MVNFCWLLFKFGAGLALVLMVAAAIYLYTRMDNEVRRLAEHALTEQFPHLEVHVGGARVIEGRGVAFYDVNFAEQTPSGLTEELLSIDELLLECDAKMTALLAGAPEITRIVAKHPQAHLRHEANGSWNLQALCNARQPGCQMPIVMIEGGALSVRDARRPQLPPMVFRDVELTMTPTHDGRQETPSGGMPPVEIEGSLAGTQLRKASLAGALTTDGRCQGRLQIEGLQVGGDVSSWLAAFAPALLDQTAVRGSVDGEVAASWRINAAGPPQIAASLSLTRGQIDDARLPMSLTDLSGRLAVDGDAILIEQVRGKCGNAAFAAAARRQGWSPQAPMAVTGRIADLPLDRRLYDALPASLREAWDKFKPAGEIDVELTRAMFDGQRWESPTATLTGRGLSFESDKFPYRLTGGVGTIRIQPQTADGPPRLDLDLTARGGGQPLRIIGQVFDPQPGARCWVEITGQGVGVDEAMIAALPPKPRQVIGEMHPNGEFDFYWRIDRKEVGSPPNKILHLQLVDIGINYKRFPYPLRGVNGVIEADNDRWRFRELRSGGRRSVQCNGYLQPTAGGSQLELTFTGQEVPLDDNLFWAVDKNVQRAWSELRPNGHIDFTAVISHQTGQRKPRIWAKVRPLPKTALIRPKFFDYRMDQLAGEAIYEDGRVELKDIRARHGQTTLATQGSGYFARDGSWETELTGLTVDRLTAARDLLAALPPKMAIMIDALEPNGAFRLYNGVLRFQKAASPTTPLHTQWDVQLDCHQTDLQCGVQFENIHGSVRLVGATDGHNNYSRGELNLETATFQDMHFTKVRGPFWVDDAQSRVGRWAQKGSGEPARRVTANVYGGAIAFDAQVALKELPEYRVDVDVANADLATMIAERFGGENDFTGKIDARLSFAGQGRLIDGLTGRGDVHVHDADIYESPVLLRLLKTLRYGKQDATAFNEVQAKFELAGRHVTLSQLDFLGDVVNLYGEGYTNFDHELDLRFHGQVGRNKFMLPLVKNVVGEVNRQIMEVTVDGTLSDPHVHTQALPGVSQLLGRREGPNSAAADRSRQALFPATTEQAKNR